MQSESRSGERRHTPRHRVEGLVSTIGPVLDLSEIGAQILADQPVDPDMTSITLRFDDGDIEVPVRLIWVRTVGDRYLVGVSFDGLSEAHVDRIVEAIEAYYQHFLRCA